MQYIILCEGKVCFKIERERNKLKEDERERERGREREERERGGRGERDSPTTLHPLIFAICPSTDPTAPAAALTTRVSPSLGEHNSSKPK